VWGTTRCHQVLPATGLLQEVCFCNCLAVCGARWGLTIGEPLTTQLPHSRGLRGAATAVADMNALLYVWVNPGGQTWVNHAQVWPGSAAGWHDPLALCLCKGGVHH
jgi:hypothetical protein